MTYCPNISSLSSPIGKLLAFKSSILFNVGIFILIGLSTSQLTAQVTWDGGGADNNWNTANNWNPNTVPTATDDVTIPNINVTITVNTAAVCNTLTVDSGDENTTITISGGNSLTVSGAVVVGTGTQPGGFIGAFTPVTKALAVATGTLTCSSFALTAPADGLRDSRLTVSTGTINVTGDINLPAPSGIGGSADFTFTDAGTLNIGGSMASGGTFAASISTVNYNGSNQTIGGYTYNTLNLIGDGECDIDGDLTVNGDLTINTVGEIDAGTATITVAGDWTNDDGTLDFSSSTVVLNGAAQNIGGTNSTSFGNLTLSGTGTKTFVRSTTIGGTLNIQTGAVADLGTFTDHTVNALALANTGQTSGTWGHSSSAATNTDDTFFANSTGVITAAVDGPTTFYTRQTGDWDNANTWSTITYGDATNTSGTYPQNGDIVNIGGALTITVTGSESCGSIDFLADDGGNSPTVTINGTNSLTVSGNITIPRGGTFFNASTNTLAVGAGTLTTTNIALEGGGASGTAALTLSTGTINVSEDISADSNDVIEILGAENNLTFTGAGTLQIGGDMFDASQGTFTASTGTVVYNGAEAQTMGDLTYNNLTLSGAGNKTPFGAIDVNGVFTLSSGTSYTPGSFTHTQAGNWVNNGGTFSATGSTISFDGTTQSISGSTATTFNNLTIDGSTTTLSLATTINATFGIANGGVANLSTITTHSAKTLSFDGGGQIPGTWGSTTSAAANTNNTYFAATTGFIDVTNTIYYTRQTGNWNVNTSWSTVDYGNATNTGTFPVTGDIARIGGGFTVTVVTTDACAFVEYETGIGNTNTVTMSGAGSLTVSDAIVISATDGDTNTFGVGAGTLNVNDIVVTPTNDGGAVTQLTISTGTATVTGDIVHNGEVGFLGAIQPANITFTDAGTLQVAGVMLNSTEATFTASTGTVEYNGSSSQTVADFTYNNLTFNNTSTDIPALTLANDLTVNSTLTMTAGVVDLASNTLALGNGGASTLTRTTSTITNWVYNGTFSRYMPATTITSNSGNYYGLFPVGTSDESSYRPVEFNSTVDPAAGTVTVNHSGASSTTTLDPFHADVDDAVDIEAKDNASFMITNSTTGGTFDLSINMTGLGSGDINDIRIAKNAGATTVTTVGTHVSATGSASAPTGNRSSVLSSELAGDWRIVTTDAAATPLPVELLSFTGQPESTFVTLQWSTATEVNNDFFELQRSIDGEHYEAIGTIKGNGTTSEIQDYVYRDRGFVQGTNYYRLKQVDFDGAYEYSDIISVNTSGLSSAMISMYPNPSSDELYIKTEGFDSQSTPMVVIRDQMGKMVYREQLTLSNGRWGTKDLSSHLNPGLYFVQVALGQNKFSQKLIYRP